MFDSNEETCWNSDQVSLQFYNINLSYCSSLSCTNVSNCHSVVFMQLIYVQDVNIFHPFVLENDTQFCCCIVSTCLIVIFSVFGFSCICLTAIYNFAFKI